MHTNLMYYTFIQEEKLFKLCRNEKAKISRFTTLLEGGSVRLNIHDEVAIDYPATIYSRILVSLARPSHPSFQEGKESMETVIRVLSQMAAQMESG